MTTTERRLAITPGTWTAQNILGHTRSGDCPKVVGPDGEVIVQLGGGELDEVEANAELIADAGTTANACDMLPSELLAKLMEAEIALLRIGQEGHCAPSDGGWDAATEYKTRRDIARKCLSTLNLPK